MEAYDYTVSNNINDKIRNLIIGLYINGIKIIKPKEGKEYCNYYPLIEIQKESVERLKTIIGIYNNGRKEGKWKIIKTMPGFISCLIPEDKKSLEKQSYSDKFNDQIRELGTFLLSVRY
jgi:hypothetical protein